MLSSQFSNYLDMPQRANSNSVSSQKKVINTDCLSDRKVSHATNINNQGAVENNVSGAAFLRIYTE